MTGGGDCPGLNAVIRSVVKTAMVRGLDVWGIEDGYLGLIENRMRPLSRENVSNILTRGGTILGTTNYAVPRRFMVGKNHQGEPIYEDRTPQVLAHLEEHKIDGLICIGGDGTMTSAAHLIEQGLPVIGVPKTIDNDIMHTDLTFGFQTAVEIATEAMDRVHTTAASHHRVMFVETMGRNAGWLALHAGMASGADIILLPEFPFRMDVIRNAIEKRRQSGRAFTIVAVSEGAKPVDGDVVVSQVIENSPDQIRLGGISRVLANSLQESGIDSRATILGHVQRGGTPCAFDRILATKFGHAAMDLIAHNKWNKMVTIHEGDMSYVSIKDVADQQRTVPADSRDLLAARDIGTCLGDY